jgi:CspA family cold shock protein
MLSLDDIQAGVNVTHKNTALRYSIVESSDDEVLLAPENSDLRDLTVPMSLFREEFVLTERFSPGRARRRSPSPSGPRCRGRIKKMVRDRGFGFIRGDDGKEVFFHRSGLGGTDYDSLSEGDAVEYVVQEGPRGPRAEHVRAAPAEQPAV